MIRTDHTAVHDKRSVKFLCSISEKEIGKLLDRVGMAKYDVVNSVADGQIDMIVFPQYF